MAAGRGSGRIDGFHIALRISTRLEKEARMSEWNSKWQTDVLRMVNARKRATDENTLCQGDSNGNVNVLSEEGGRVHTTRRGGRPWEAAGPGGGDESRGLFRLVCVFKGGCVCICCLCN